MTSRPARGSVLDAAERHRTLLEINNAIISNLTRDALFAAIAHGLRRVLPVDRTAIFLHDRTRDVLTLYMLEATLPSRYFRAGLEMPAGDSHVGRVFREARPLLRRDLEREAEFEMEARAVADGVRSFAIVPLLLRGTPIGTLAVASTRPGEYDDADVQLLQEIAAQVALAVENMRVHEELAASSRATGRLLEDVRREVAHRRRAEELLRAIMQGTAAATGADFFASLVRHLASGLGVRHAFVAECTDATRDVVRTVAFWRDDRLAEPMEYAVARTPCERVLAGAVSHHAAGVQAAFPGDPGLARLGAESYLGVPIVGAAGGVIGHVAVLDDAPMATDPLTLWVLQTFAARAGAELERQRSDAALRAMHRFSQEVVEGASEGIIVYDTALRYVVFNRFMEELTGVRAADVLGRYAPDVFPFLRETGMEAMLRRALAGEVVSTPDILVRMPNGREVWEANTYGPHRDAQGAIVGVIALVGDITRRRAAEDALRAALAEVEQLKNRLQRENVYLQEEIRREHNFAEMVGSSPALLATLRRVEQVAATDSTVLISGETGTGKELVARAIHDRSARRARPLVKVNCAAISAGLVESELFGHVKGAFTGALERRHGRFELADGGTLLLDEVGELPLETQVKLLRALQEQEFEPVGSSRSVRVDVRVLAATNRDLAEAVRAGRFRADLYYRLAVVLVEVPPLRARRSDIPQLVMFFLTRFAKRFGKAIDVVSRETMERLMEYPWPGNIRELQNVIERAVVLADGPVLELDDHWLPPLGGAADLAGAAGPAAGAPRGAPGAPDPPTGSGPAGGAAPPPGAPAPGDTAGEPPTLQELERRHILATLERAGWIIEGPRGAARVLGLHPNTLRSRMERLGIRRPRHGPS
jgi:PAS domain S-box-containing protein